MNETLKTESPKEDENDVNDTSLNESSFVLSSALSNLEDNDTQKIPNTPINFNHNKKKALIPKEVNSVKKRQRKQAPFSHQLTHRERIQQCSIISHNSTIHSKHQQIDRRTK